MSTFQHHIYINMEIYAIKFGKQHRSYRDDIMTAKYLNIKTAESPGIRNPVFCYTDNRNKKNAYLLFFLFGKSHGIIEYFVAKYSQLQ